ncbi:MAG TPA: ABC transporter substrate-binding protein [Acidimicrobiales bacterium]|nr:ABC transporter substrate-binding protein [Acidimicrobiales bacterium]
MRSGTATSRRGLAAIGITVLLAGCASAAGSEVPGAVPAGPGAGRAPITIGAVFPVHGMQSVLAGQELQGVRLAVQLVNASGGVGGRKVDLAVQDLETRDQAATAVAAVKRAGASIVIGAFSSQLSMPAAAAASQDGLVYWEAGAVADQLTGPGSPLVFRIGATGGDLGRNSAGFAANVLAPRLGLSPASTRVAVLYENDDYGQSVADAAMATARSEGMPLVASVSYDAYAPQWGPVLQQLALAHPDVLVLASYIPDGIAFRRAMLASGLHVGALIGSTMAECGPTFGSELGPQAVGVFASDRPEGGFNPSALDVTGARDYDRLAAAWKAATGQPAPTEEGLAGFSAAWALLHYVLPRAVSAGALSPAKVASAANSTVLPAGSLPNGAGLHFGTGAQLGQNVLAAAVIWQWQSPGHSVVVWPPAYATGTPRFLPLPA